MDSIWKSEGLTKMLNYLRFCFIWNEGLGKLKTCSVVSRSFIPPVNDFYFTWNEEPFGFPSMTAHGHSPGLASVPPVILVISLRPQDVARELVVGLKGIVCWERNVLRSNWANSNNVFLELLCLDFFYLYCTGFNSCGKFNISGSCNITWTWIPKRNKYSNVVLVNSCTKAFNVT